MNKETLREELIARLETQRHNALIAADNAHDAATHEQSKAETQYDTVGLENAYLAHGQSQRVADCEQAILRLKSLKLQDFDEDAEIDLGAIVRLSSGPTYWLLPVAGGTKLAQGSVIVVTPASPLGEGLLGAYIEEVLPDGREITEIA